MYYALCFSSIWHKRQITFNDLGRCYFPSLAVLLTAIDCYIMSFLGPLLGCQAGVPTIQAVVVRVFKALVCN